MGVVYKAHDEKLDRCVALKFLPPHLDTSEAEKQRFIQEARAASKLDHPNICTIHEIDETEDGQLFICMAYYEGETLREKVASNQLSVTSVIEIATQIANGLAKAHAHGIIHRDIKPANVIITKDGVVKILDFGLAKLAGGTRLTKTGTTMGTAAYMSPEQVHRMDADHRTDIWSLGVVMYEMLTGKLPFEGEYEQAIMYAIVNMEPEPVRSLKSEVSIGLEQIVDKCLAKEPDERYQNITDLLADLKSPIEKIENKKPFSKPKLGFGERWHLYAGLAALIVALILAGLFWRPKSVEAIDSIAVLPLENMTGDPNQEYFVDGMTEALIINLAKISSLRVISRTSVMQYKKARKTLPEIAKELNVTAIVEGSVARSGDRVRITAQLINAPTDRHLWANSYDRDLRDVLALQSEVTTTIVRELQVKLTPQEQARLTSARPINPDAYEAYLKGRFFLNKWTEEDAKKAVDFFQKAIDLDPTYAMAYAGLADYYTQSSYYTYMSATEANPKAKAAAMKALEYDETLAEAHVALGNVKLLFDWDFPGAEREFMRAIEFNPNNVDARNYYTVYLVAMGRFNEAIAQSKRNKELDPLTLVRSLNLGWIYFNARRYDESIIELKKTLELDPDFHFTHAELGWNYAFKGMFKEAIAASEKALSLSPSPADLLVLSSVGYVYGISGKPDEARKILNQLVERKYVDSYYVAGIYAALREKDRAFEWLNKAYDERSPSMIALKIEPFFDNLRNDPRYTELLRKTGLEK
jgi:serine/threonine-protein kinase